MDNRTILKYKIMATANSRPGGRKKTRVLCQSLYTGRRKWHDVTDCDTTCPDDLCAAACRAMGLPRGHVSMDDEVKLTIDMRRDDRRIEAENR